MGEAENSGYILKTIKESYRFKQKMYLQIGVIMDKFRKGYFKLYFKPNYFFRMADRRKKYVRTSEGNGEYKAVVIQPLNKKWNVKT